MSEQEVVYLTPEGVEKLKAELEELRGPRRQELAQRLRRAIQMGDLSENADYIAAKEEQAFLEGRIQELEALLRNAVIIETPTDNDVVRLGSTVVVAENGRTPETYQIVGAKEADPRRGRISNESPIGRALLGRRAGEEVEVEAPGGTLRLKILEIQ